MGGSYRQVATLTGVKMPGKKNKIAPDTSGRVSETASPESEVMVRGGPSFLHKLRGAFIGLQADPEVRAVPKKPLGL